jgi:thiol:disulfide interchange protein DsbC
MWLVKDCSNCTQPTIQEHKVCYLSAIAGRIAAVFTIHKENLMIKPICSSSVTYMMLAISLWLGSSVVKAEAGDQADPATQAIRASLAKALPTLKPDSIAPSPIQGLYEVMLGPRLIYISADGKYLMTGEMSDLQSGENLTEPKLRAANLKAVNDSGEENMIVFGPDDAKHTISVFTDIDCGYCRKLHSEMDAYNAAGIRVRYLFYPRAGLGSEAYNKGVSVWCADDRKQAMTDAKSGKKLEAKTCDNPVSDHYQLGQSLSLRGTPALVLDDGEILPGYVPATRLKKLLDERASVK